MVREFPYRCRQGATGSPIADDFRYNQAGQSPMLVFFLPVKTLYWLVIFTLEPFNPLVF
jgi:hypothetical protein